MMLRCACRTDTRASRADDTDASRRRLLGWAALGLVVVATGALAGCGERDGGARSTAPAEITASTACALDGMLLADYGGPKAQIHYANEPAPVFLCDTLEMFNMLLRPEQVRKVLAVYVQDMGRADWDQPRGHWIDATTAFYVRGSKRHGSMGPTIASFAQEADATKFIGEYGGTLLRYADVTADMVDLSGGSKFETRM